MPSNGEVIIIISIIIHEFSRARQPLHCSQTNMFKLSYTVFPSGVSRVGLKGGFQKSQI